jgi:hypothetical protein
MQYGRSHLDSHMPWGRLGIGALLTLAAILLAIAWFDASSALLLGWGIGMVIAAVLILLRRRD